MAVEIIVITPSMNGREVIFQRGLSLYIDLFEKYPVVGLSQHKICRNSPKIRPRIEGFVERY